MIVSVEGWGNIFLFMAVLKMRNLEVVVMLIKNTDRVIKDVKKFNKPYRLFDENILSFLETFNNELKK